MLCRYLDPKQNVLAATVRKVLSLHEMKLKGAVREDFYNTNVEKLVDALVNNSQVDIATRRTVLDDLHADGLFSDDKYVSASEALCTLMLQDTEDEIILVEGTFSKGKQS